MSILLAINQLRDKFFATDPPPDAEKLLTEYRALFDLIQHDIDIPHTRSEIKAVSDLNVAFVAHHLKLTQGQGKVDLPLTRAAIDWNLGHHEDRIPPETLVYTLLLRVLVFKEAPLSKLKADLDKALTVAYCERVDFLAVAAAYRLRSRVLEKMAKESAREAKESAREAIVFSAWDDDYKKVVGRHDSGVNEALRTLTGLR